MFLHKRKKSRHIKICTDIVLWAIKSVKEVEMLFSFPRVNVDELHNSRWSYCPSLSDGYK